MRSSYSLFILFQFLLVILLGNYNLLTKAGSDNGVNKYCATIDTSGALGHVSIEISNGVAYYMLNLDINSLSTPSLTCDYNEGLTFHIHSYWTTSDTTTTSVAYPTCASSITGLHYDPNFACSPKSQQSSTGCKSLNRYYPHHNYTCNSTVFNGQGQYSLCEVGDLTGKFGVIYPKTTANFQFTTPVPWTDYLPPYPYNFDRADLVSNMWSSIVFHCRSPSAYLLCAKLSTTELSSCNADFSSISSYSSNNNDDGSGGEYSPGSLAAGILVSMFSFFFIGMGTLYLLQSKQGMFLVEGPKHHPTQQSRDSESHTVQSGLHTSIAADPEVAKPNVQAVDNNTIERQSTFM